MDAPDLLNPERRLLSMMLDDPGRSLSGYTMEETLHIDLSTTEKFGISDHRHSLEFQCLDNWCYKFFVARSATRSVMSLSPAGFSCCVVDQLNIMDGHKRAVYRLQLQ